MPKKVKDSGDGNPGPEIKPVSNSTSVFVKLFGEAPENDAPISSLFSEHNPFRRKHGDDPTLANQSSGLSSTEGKKPNETPNNGEAKKEKKTKKKNEKGTKKNKGPVVDIETNMGSQDESKEGEILKNNTPSDVIEDKHQSVEKTGGEGNPLSDSLKSGKKDKKKRKRDELEEEYEAKKYGKSASDKQLTTDKGGEKHVVGKKRKNVDDPAALTISKEGYDDESKLLRTIFVGNLPLKVKKKALLKEFSQFGEVESVRIRSVPTLDGKKPKKVMIMNNKINEAADSVHAYIVFQTEQSADASLSHNMSIVEGNHIRVDRACPPRKKLKGGGDHAALYDNKRTLFVGNLPFDVKDEEMYKLFTSINQVASSIEAVRVIRDPHTSLGKGIAYVLFKTREAANLVVRRRNLKIRERELRITHASSTSNTSNTPTKRKEFQSRESNIITPGKKRAMEPRTPTSSAARNRPKMKSTPSASFEGVRATKSGTEKKKPKLHQHLSARPVTFKSQQGGIARPVTFKSQQGGGVVKERLQKRPSVAARKAKANGLNKVDTDGGGSSGKRSNQGGGGKKRKTGSRTPQSSFQKNKRPRKF